MRTTHEVHMIVSVMAQWGNECQIANNLSVLIWKASNTGRLVDSFELAFGKNQTAIAKWIEKMAKRVQTES